MEVRRCRSEKYGGKVLRRAVRDLGKGCRRQVPAESTPTPIDPVFDTQRRCCRPRLSAFHRPRQ